jgi:hypothetical protein
MISDRIFRSQNYRFQASQGSPSINSVDELSCIKKLSQRLVNTSLCDFNGRAVAVARVQQNDAQHLLAEKLHICAGSID